VCEALSYKLLVYEALSYSSALSLLQEAVVYRTSVSGGVRLTDMSQVALSYECMRPSATSV
jgi:hypothetical protein